VWQNVPQTKLIRKCAVPTDPLIATLESLSINFLSRFLSLLLDGPFLISPSYRQSATPESSSSPLLISINKKLILNP